MKYRFIFWLILISNAVSGMEFPVLLRLNQVAQTDTTGCNFVAELSALAYKEVKEGRLTLWDSPAKELQINAESLDAICASSGVKMGNDPAQFIHIYEYWEEEKSNIKSRTTGILFSAKDKSGRDISFGYILYSDFETACLRYKINTNVNGDYAATAATYLSNKNYNFSLLQFNGHVVSGVEESAEILSSWRKGRPFNMQRGNIQPVQLKFIRMEIVMDSSDFSGEALLSRQFVMKADSFFHANEEFLYNNTGDSVHHLLQTKHWKLTGVRFAEIWRHDQSGIFSSLTGMTLYVNGEPLTELPFRVLAGLEFQVYNTPFHEWLSGHTYSYRMLSINNQELGRAEAMLYAKALNNAAWNRLSDYVRYY